MIKISLSKDFIYNWKKENLTIKEIVCHSLTMQITFKYIELSLYANNIQIYRIILMQTALFSILRKYY